MPTPDPFINIQINNVELFCWNIESDRVFKSGHVRHWCYRIHVAILSLV